MPQRFRQFLSFLIKVFVSALLLYLSLRWVDTSQIAGRLARIDLRWVGLVLFLVAIQIGVLAQRWRQIVMVAGAALQPLTAVRFGLIAAFFSQTLPSTIGGDAARVVMLGRHASWTAATYSVLVDRAVGLLALAVVVTAFLPLTFALVSDPAARLGLVTIAILGIGGPVVFTVLGFVPGRWVERFWATRHLSGAAKVARDVWSSPPRALLVAALSLLIHVLSVTAVWAAAHAVTAPLGFAAAFSIVPPVILLSTIPISIAGWGVRESAMIAAFGYAGLAQGDGLMVSLIFGAATFAIGAIGGLVWIASAERVPMKVIQDRR